MYNSIDKYKYNIALVDEKERIFVFSQLVEAAKQLKKFIPERSLVFNLCSNSIESVVAYVGILRANSVQALLNSDIKASLLNKLIKLYNPKYLFLPKVKVGEINEDNKIVIFERDNFCLVEIPVKRSYKIDDNLALLLTTSGSTGSPKFVRQSYINIKSNAESIVNYLEIKADDRAITTLPMSYTYGLSIINSHLLSGASIVLTNRSFMEGNFWKLLKKTAPTTFGGVPYTYEILKKLRFERMDLHNLKYLTQAGGKLSKKLSLEFAQICNSKNIRFYTMYGQTEATARMSYVPYEYAEKKAGSIGIAIPGGKFYLIDGLGNIIRDNKTIGELVYEGNNVTMGYAESCADLAKQDESKGRLVTGDMAKRDDDGFYYIVGRKKRFLKLYGLRVNLDEVETMLKSNGYDVACTGQDDELLVYTTSTEKLEDIKYFILKHTDINIRGFSIVFINEIPRNEAGKILYTKLPQCQKS